MEILIVVYCHQRSETKIQTAGDRIVGLCIQRMGTETVIERRHS